MSLLWGVLAVFVWLALAVVGWYCTVRWFDGPWPLVLWIISLPIVGTITVLACIPLVAEWVETRARRLIR